MTFDLLDWLAMYSCKQYHLEGSESHKIFLQKAIKEIK
jgi:hypothetical protein